jgi:hypothetical protein
VDAKQLGTWLMVIGASVVALGAALYLGWLSFLGRLPGDLRFGSENVRVYIPLASMLVISLILTLVLNLCRRLF